jgi:hypothetical protein
MHRLLRVALGSLLILAADGPLTAQEATDERTTLDFDDLGIAGDGIEHLAEAQFGTMVHTTVIGAPDFRPLTSDTSFAYDGAGYLYRTGGGNTTFWAPLHLPPGALISGLCFSGYDAAGTDLTYDFAEYEMAGPNQSPGFHVILSTQSSGGWDPSSTGYGRKCHSLAPNHTVRVYGDFNGDLVAGPLVQRLVFDLPEADSDHRLGSVEVQWRRSVSPAPPSASYTDVPVGHPQRQYVEALRAAGITSGCAASPARFCPDLPVTRGQMAVFLAKALGLHWPL